jgi:hypothetical protein
LGSRIHIDLGPYAEPLRLFLIDAAPFPLEVVLNIVVYIVNDCPSSQTSTPSLGMNINLGWGIILLIFGLLMVYFVRQSRGRQVRQ